MDKVLGLVQEGLNKQQQQEEEKRKKEGGEKEEEFRKGTYIDAKDTVNQWCVAEVIDWERGKRRLGIHYEGWSAKFDDSLVLQGEGHPKLGPFRRNSRGYTGQVRAAYRSTFELGPEMLRKVGSE